MGIKLLRQLKCMGRRDASSTVLSRRHTWREKLHPRLLRVSLLGWVTSLLRMQHSNTAALPQHWAKPSVQPPADLWNMRRLGWSPLHVRANYCCMSLSSMNERMAGRLEATAASPASMASAARWNSSQPISPTLGAMSMSTGSAAKRIRDTKF